MSAGRVMVKLLREIAIERGIEMQTSGHDWVIRLEKSGVVRWVFGYDFELNSAAAHLIAKDKSAGCDAMRAGGVDCVAHELFIPPSLRKFVGDAGSFASLHETFTRFGRDVVVKPNDGTGGLDVMRCRSLPELEEAVVRVWGKQRAACVSPFERIEREVRLVMLDGEVLVMYEKRRPEVIGDGRSTQLELLGGQVSQPEAGLMLSAIGRDARESNLDLSRVPKAGERVVLNWRHNLGQGAGIHELEPTDELHGSAIELARRAAKSMNLRFGSIDLIEVRSIDGESELKVLEVNAGVMMESFARLASGGLEKSKLVYARALDAMFGVMGGVA
jgi:D-alanine-D-alanine ligase-like ATP-grasp enzyme